MDMPRLLIADSSEELRQILFDNLMNTYHVKVCSDGAQALELTRTFHPDILVLDLMMPMLDGITLLHRIRAEGLRPAVITTSILYNAYIIGALQQLEVDYMMAKPCQWQAIVERANDIAAMLQPAQLPKVEVGSAVSSLLLGMGISPGKDGFRYLQAAIPLYMRDPGQSITKELYVDVGKLYNKSGTQVERSIRSAIETAWKTADMHVWCQYFPAPSAQIPRPTNTDFISRIATELSAQGYRLA